MKLIPYMYRLKNRKMVPVRWNHIVAKHQDQC
jgi:hypothetical protein